MKYTVVSYIEKNHAQQVSFLNPILFEETKSNPLNIKSHATSICCVCDVRTQALLCCMTVLQARAMSLKLLKVQDRYYCKVNRLIRKKILHNTTEWCQAAKTRHTSAAPVQVTEGLQANCACKTTKKTPVRTGHNKTQHLSFS